MRGQGNFSETPRCVGRLTDYGYHLARELGEHFGIGVMYYYMGEILELCNHDNSQDSWLFTLDRESQEIILFRKRRVRSPIWRPVLIGLQGRLMD